MQNLLQPGLLFPQRSSLVRLLALASVLIITIMSTAQVCHTHDLLPPPTGAHSGVPSPGIPGPETGPDHCPLCVAMHSAMPATLQDVPEPVLLMHTLDSAAADAERIFRWRFELASRPPPAGRPRA